MSLNLNPAASRRGGMTGDARKVPFLLPLPARSSVVPLRVLSFACSVPPLPALDPGRERLSRWRHCPDEGDCGGNKHCHSVTGCDMRATPILLLTDAWAFARCEKPRALRAFLWSLSPRIHARAAGSYVGYGDCIGGSACVLPAGAHCPFALSLSLRTDRALAFAMLARHVG